MAIVQGLPKVLLVEDDRGIAGALVHALGNTYEVKAVSTAESAFYKVDTGHYDLIILDLGLPDMPGSVVCRELRERGLVAPILVLTADTGVLTKIKLLDAGANDYLTKPFSLGELKARLRALTRDRQRPVKPAGKLMVGSLELDRRAYQVKRGGVSIGLRRKEFMMLEYLMEHAGSVVTRRALARYAWHGAEDLWTNTVDVHIKHLRDKIDRPFGEPLIRTVYGVGYKLEAAENGPARES